MPDVIVGRRRPRRWRAARRLMAASLLPLLISGGAAARAQTPPSPISPIPPRRSHPRRSRRRAEAAPSRPSSSGGDKALSEETLRYYLGIEPGQPLDEDALNRNIKKLWDRNLVDDIQVESVPTAAGVRLVVTVAARPVLRSIDYQGLKRISKTDLQES